MQRLVYGADAGVMLMLMFIALYSSGGKQLMHARGEAEKCNAMLSLGNAGRPVDQVSACRAVHSSNAGVLFAKPLL